MREMDGGSEALSSLPKEVVDMECESAVVSFKGSCPLHPVPMPPKVLGFRVSRQ